MHAAEDEPAAGSHEAPDSLEEEEEEAEAGGVTEAAEHGGIQTVFAHRHTG